jgi:hypothetical protein
MALRALAAKGSFILMQRYFFFFLAFFSLVAILLTAPQPGRVFDLQAGARQVSSESNSGVVGEEKSDPKVFEKNLLKVEAVVPDRPSSARLVIEPVSSEEYGKTVYYK